MRRSSDPRLPQSLVTGSFQSVFRIEALLGEGGMGRVYAAHDLNLDRPVAIKVMHERLATDGMCAARFLREARLMARLSSDHTVRVHSIGRDEHGAAYFVMERADGRDLDALVSEHGMLPCEVALEYARQMCVAVAEAHALGIVHRDIKPGNVLVGVSAAGLPLVKVVDFGLAREERRTETSGLTSMSELLGTPEYMSPEQLRSTRDVDHRSDIWSLGATIFFMLTGRAPFVGETLDELIESIQHGPLPSVRALRPDVPQHVELALARCFHRDPHGRFKGVEALVAALGVATSSGRLPSINTPDAPFEPTVTQVVDRTVALPGAPVRPQVADADSVASPIEAPSGRPTPRRRRSFVPVAIALVGGLVAGSAFTTALALWSGRCLF